MMKKSLGLFVFIFILIANGLFAQNFSPVVHPKVIKQPVDFYVIPNLRNRPVVTDFHFRNEEFDRNEHNKRHLKNLPIPDFSRIYAHRPASRPADIQTVQPTIIHNFAGQNSGAFPPDASGSVNENYYFQVVNTTYTIFDKNGNVLAGPSDLNSIFNGNLQGAGNNDGDPIVLWDEQAGKWLYAEFSVSGNNDYMLIAVSQTDDPTGAWWSWSYDVSDMPDYMKFGIWQDGYYMATNTTNGNDVYVFERDKMIQGDPSPRMIGFDNPNRPNTFDGFHCIMPVDNDGPWAPAGTPGQFITVVDDDQNNPADQLWIYQLDVDWSNPGNSTFQRTQTINIPSFTGNFTGNWDNIPQPGTSQKLDAVSTILMFRAVYRNFNGDQRLVVAHTIAESQSEGAVRWYELQSNGGNWSIRQNGEINLNGTSCWLPSIAINARKEIAIGYCISDANQTYPSIRITGQTATENNNASGILDVDYTSVIDGQYAQTQVNRWGDYAQMSVDPNGRTFWFTTEYVKSNTHGTRIVAFEFPQNCTPPTAQASNFQVNNIDANSVDISWSRGNGDRVLVVAREGSAVNADPVSGTAYMANATFGNGDQTGSGNYVVYNGTGTSVHVTGLNSATTYYFAVYEFNAADDCYLTPGLSGNATTAGPPSVQTVSVSNVTVATADAQGEVISENGSAVTERGFCWSTSVNPTLADNHLSAGSGTGTFTATLSGLNPNTTYYVRAYATNANGTSYGQNISFATECGLITDFPYLESFNTMAESNPGTDCTPDGSVALTDCWQNLTGDDADWDIISGATPSTGTGPFFDANDWPGKYIYLEASTCTGKTASFESPAFDFSNLSTPELRFNYHMFGADMGSLEVSISTDNGSTWTNIRSVSGDQGMEWHEAIVDLSAYAGENNVHFKFTGNTGSSYLSDIAVDNIIVQEATGISSYRNYCSMSGNMDYGTALTGVVLNQISVGSGKSAPYENFIQVSTELQKGQTYQLHTYVDTDGNYDVYVRAWIDWNQDGDFDDSGEEYDLGYATDVSQGETSLSPLDIQVPTNAKNGFTRMRIAAKYNSYPSMCETGFDGETEDYGIIVFDNRCNSVARWNGTLWKTPAGDTLTTADLTGRFLQTDNLLYLKDNDLQGCSIEIGKGKTLVAGSDHALKVTYDVFNHGYLEIRNNASLVQSNDNSVIRGNGKYVMKRISDSLYHYYDYAYWSSPLNSSAFTLGDLENNAWRYYSFDATIQDPSQIPNSGWVERQPNDVFQTGSGYAVSAPNGFPGGIIKAVFQKNNDPFNNGAIQVPVYINGQGASGNDDWNLLGNPYPSALDFDQLVNNNPNIEGSLYLWTNCAGLDANGQHQESGYSIYNQTGSIAACSGNGLTAGQYVASGQGFMVEANANGTVTFSNTERATNNNHFLNRVSQDRVKIHLTDENNHRFRQILIAFDQAATDGHDRLYDAHAIDDAWFAVQNNEAYSIIAYSAWNDTDRTVPLGFRAPADGNYEVALDEVTGVLQNIHIYLHDIPNNVYYPLNNGAYTFYSSAGLHTGRFEILFTRQTLQSTMAETGNQISVIRSSEDKFIVKSSIEKISGVEIFTADGRLLIKQNGNNSMQVNLSLRHIPHQAIIFHITTSKNHLYVRKYMY